MSGEKCDGAQSHWRGSRRCWWISGDIWPYRSEQGGESKERASEQSRADLPPCPPPEEPLATLPFRHTSTNTNAAVAAAAARGEARVTVCLLKISRMLGPSHRQ